MATVERSLILLKPDAVARRLMGEIIGRLEQKGLKIVALKLMRMSDELAAQHYAAHRQKPFYGPLVKFMTSSPIVALVVEGFRAVSVCRKLMGATFGYDAEPGTIRGDLGISNQANLIHGSDSPEAAGREIALFFKETEILSYRVADEAWNAAE